MVLNVTGGKVQSRETPVSTPSRTQKETNYVKQTPDPLRRCGICSHYLGEGMCELVIPEPKPIVADGVCDLFASQPVKMGDNVLEQALIPNTVTEQETGKGYFYLSIRYVWEIEKLQSALYAIFGYNVDWRWIDPWTYHVTLAYADEISDEQMAEAIKAVIGKNAFKIKFVAVDSFESGEERAIYLKAQPSSDLIELQQALYDNLSAQGVELSPFSVPSAYVPHLTMAYVPLDLAIPTSEIGIEAWVEEVCLGRSNYKSIAKVPLNWDSSWDEDRGDSPTVEFADWTNTDGWRTAVQEEIPWDAKAAAESVLSIEDAAVRWKTASESFWMMDKSNPSLMSSYRYPMARWDGEKLITSAGARASAKELFNADVDRVISEGLRKGMLQQVEDAAKDDPVTEMNTPELVPIRMTMISELRGAYPDIPLPKDVNLNELEAVIGEKPIFVTLPIGEIDAKSGNGRVYRKKAVEMMVEAVNKQRPYGNWGHMQESELSHRFDPPAIQWFAAMIDDKGVAWGKALPLTKETRDYYRTAKATNSKTGTSLYGIAGVNGSDVETLELKMIDIADPARVGIKMTAAKAHLTHEMGDVFVRETPERPAQQEKQPDRNIERKIDMELQEQVTELTGERDKLQTRVTELEAQAQRVSELETANVALRTEVGVLLAEYVSKSLADHKVIESAQGVIKTYVVAAAPKNKTEVDAAVESTLERPEVQEMLKAMLAGSNPALPNPPTENLNTPIWNFGADQNSDKKE